MAKNARFAVLTALKKMENEEAYSNLVLGEVLENSPKEDRAFISALFYGVIIYKLQFDYIIGKLSKTPLNKLSQNVRIILYMGLYQLMYMDSVKNFAAVSETVNLAALAGEKSAGGFINALLRNFLRNNLKYPEPRDPQSALSVKYSVPMPLISLWRKSYGHEETIKILEASVTNPPVFARVNTTKTTRAELLKKLSEEGISAEEAEDFPNAVTVKGGVMGNKAFKEGLFHVQDLSSQMCAAAVDAKKGMRVLDICAAPGGKSFTIAENMENEGEVVSCDLYAHRTALIKEGAERLGLGIIHPMVNDAAVYSEKLGLFDRVLCDAPCSGYGTIRRKPEIRYKDLKSVAGLPEIQSAIVKNAACYVKAGGKLIYSTCTLNPKENGDVVKKFLSENSGFRLEEEKTVMPKAGGSDGFYFAVMIKD